MALLDWLRAARSLSPQVRSALAARTPRKSYTLRDLATQDQSYADRLIYDVKVHPNIVQTRDLAFTRTYRYKGKDLAAASDNTRNALCERLNRVLRDYKDGWMFHVDLDRRRTTYYPESDFVDTASWLVDQERRERFAGGDHYISDTYLTITFAPPRSAALAARTWIYASNTKARRQAMDATYGRKLFDEGCARFEAAFSQDFAIEPLGLRTVSVPGEGPVTMDDQLAFFLSCTTAKRQNLRAIPAGCDVSEYVASETIFNDQTLRIGNHLARVLTVIDFPDYHLPNILDFLDQIPGTFRVNWRYIAREREAALKQIKAMRGRNLQKRHGAVDTVVKTPNALTDGDAVRMQHDAEEALDQFKAGAVQFGMFSFNIVFYEEIAPQIVTVDGLERYETVNEAHDRTQVEQDALVNAVASGLQARGFPSDQNLGNTFEAFLGTLPAHGYYNVVKADLSSRVLSNFIPTTTVWQGNPFCSDAQYPKGAPCLTVFSTNGNTPYYFDPSSGNRGGHSIVIGETGTGKSALAGLLLNQHRRYCAYPGGAQQIIIDRDFSHELQTHAVGGEHHLVGPGAAMAFAPFRWIDDDEEFEWAEAFAAVLLKQQGLDPLQHGEELYRALCALRQAPIDQRTMSDLAAAYGLSPAVQKVFRHYATGGSAGSMFDARESTLGTVDFTCFEISPLLEESHLHLPGMLALLHEIERQCKNGIPTLLVTEELWALLEDPTAAKIIKKWLKTMRKKNVWVMLITQSLEDVEKTPIASTIIGSCVTKIVLAHEDLVSDENRRRLRSLKMEDWEIEALASMAGQHVMYVLKPEGRRMVAIPLDPVTRATVGISNAKERARAAGFMAAYREHWYPEWINANAGELWRRHLYYAPQHTDTSAAPGPLAPIHRLPHPSDPAGEILDDAALRDLGVPDELLQGAA